WKREPEIEDQTDEGGQEKSQQGSDFEQSHGLVATVQPLPKGAVLPAEVTTGAAGISRNSAIPCSVAPDSDLPFQTLLM
ncbi:MAG: hypothetical protein AB1898_33565, partial [Acidobacteriota bacterium]